MAAKKKLKIKDLSGKKLSKSEAENVKGGQGPKIICFAGTRKS
jgi:hypothetical protein